MHVKELRKGNHFMYRDEPYRVLAKTVIAVGTHSHTKIKIEAVGMLSGKTESINFAPHGNVDDVDILRKKGQVISDQPQLQIMDLVSYETLNATANEEMRKELQVGDGVTFIEFKGVVRILERRA